MLPIAESTDSLILEKISGQLHIRNMADYALLRGGLVEWVRDGAEWVGLGVPRPEFQPNLWDPLVDVVRPVRHEERLPYFGFRLVRRGDWYLAGKDKARVSRSIEIGPKTHPE